MKSDLLAELTDVMSDGVVQDLSILSISIDNSPWGQYQPLIPNFFLGVYFFYISEKNLSNSNTSFSSATFEEKLLLLLLPVCWRRLSIFFPPRNTPRLFFVI